MTENFFLVRLSPEHIIKPFRCDDNDLNDFFHNDALPHAIQLLAVTYILESDSETIAFFSLLNDKISISDMPSKTMWKKLISKAMPERKKYRSYPAVKLGRLGVNDSYAGKGYGTMILDFIKELFVYKNRTGCRFITVDAYNDVNVLKFYQKNDFKFLTTKDEKEQTRLMYYDLKQVTN